ncbi:35208_t:CDS:2, partial [Gigaspora margarita]
PKETILIIIRELPIWPIRSSRKHKFISANDKGILPPYNLSCLLQDTDIFDVQNDYYNVLISLGVEKIKAYDFVKKYYSHSSGKQPTQQDVKFLKEILSLRNKKIVSYLASRESIPNKSLKEFVKANTLFDAEVDIIFDDDKLLPLELQNNLNGSTYVEYAHEIQKKINNNDDEISEYERKQLHKIDFIPSKKDLLNICWTQTKFIYSDDVELPFDLRPGLKMVINHWIKLSTEVFPHETSGWEVDKIYEIMEKFYQVVNDNLNLLDEDKIREFKLKDIKLFLNGKKLVFGLQNNLNGCFNNVHDHLLSFKKLLKTLGAEEVNDIKMDKILINYSQNDHLIQYLIENFAKYFDWHFSEKPKDFIQINDVKHETYKVLLRWLYGMSYEDAVKNVFREDFLNSGQRYFDFMLELLKVSHKFTHLNHIIQNNIMSKNIINVSNVKKIKEAIYNFNTDHLKQYCEEYIEKNEKIIDAKDLCD